MVRKEDEVKIEPLRDGSFEETSDNANLFKTIKKSWQTILIANNAVNDEPDFSAE